MGYVVSGAPATLTSVTSGAMVTQLLSTGTRQLSFAIDTSGDKEDTTPLDGSTIAGTSVAGLRSGTIGFEGMFARSAPTIGNAGLVTLDSSTAGTGIRLHEYEISIDFGEEDITGFNATPPTWKVFRPGGLYRWSGRFMGRLVTGATAGVPAAPNVTGASATFKLAEDGAADPAFSGSIFVPGIGHTINRQSSSQALSYTFEGSGALTETKGSTLPGLLMAATGALARTTSGGAEGSTDWDLDADGVPDVSAVLTAASGITYTVPVFLKSLSIKCAVGSVTRVSGQLRMAGALVVAP